MNVFFFLLVAGCWGGSFIAIQPLVKVMPPLLAAALRLAVGLATLSVVLPVMKVPFCIPKGLRVRIWTTGIVAFGVPFALLFWGEKSISAGLAGILNGTVPIWVFILGLLFTPRAEPTSARKIFGLLAGMGGVVAIFLPKLLAVDADPSFLGTVAVALMAVSYAASVLMNRTLFSRHPGLSPFTNLFHQLLAGFLVLLSLSLAFEGIPRPDLWYPMSTVVAAELYLGCVSTCLAFMLFYHLIRKWGSVRSATVTYVIPVITLGLDFAINSHMPSRSEIFGVFGVTVGVVILNLPSPVRAKI